MPEMMMTAGEDLECPDLPGFGNQARDTRGLSAVPIVPNGIPDPALTTGLKSIHIRPDPYYWISQPVSWIREMHSL